MTRPQRLRSELRISSKLLLMMAPKSSWWLSSLLSTKAKHWTGIMLLEMRLQKAANIFCFSFTKVASSPCSSLNTTSSMTRTRRSTSPLSIGKCNPSPPLPSWPCCSSGPQTLLVQSAPWCCLAGNLHHQGSLCILWQVCPTSDLLLSRTAPGSRDREHRAAQELEREHQRGRDAQAASSLRSPSRVTRPAPCPACQLCTSPSSAIEGGQEEVQLPQVGEGTSAEGVAGLEEDKQSLPLWPASSLLDL